MKRSSRAFSKEPGVLHRQIFLIHSSKAYCWPAHKKLQITGVSIFQFAFEPIKVGGAFACEGPFPDAKSQWLPESPFCAHCLDQLTKSSIRMNISSRSNMKVALLDIECGVIIILSILQLSK